MENLSGPFGLNTLIWHNLVGLTLPSEVRVMKMTELVAKKEKKKQNPRLKCCSVVRTTMLLRCKKCSGPCARLISCYSQSLSFRNCFIFAQMTSGWPIHTNKPLWSYSIVQAYAGSSKQTVECLGLLSFPPDNHTTLLCNPPLTLKAKKETLLF